MAAPAPDRLVSVALTCRPYTLLTYLWPQGLALPEPGTRVLAPLSNRIRVGVAMGKAEPPPARVRLREAVWPLERKPVLDAQCMGLVNTLGARQMAEPGRIVHAVLPQGLRRAEARFVVRQEEGERIVTARELADMSQAERRSLAEAWAEGRMDPLSPDKSRERHLTLLKDPPWPVRPGAANQHKLLEALYEHGSAPQAMLSKTLGPWVPATAKRLEAMGLVEAGELAVHTRAEQGRPSADHPELTPEQAEALRGVLEGFASAEPEVRLLHGVTGSGKTYVYMHAAKACLEAGRSVFLLAPEVALARNLYVAARDFLGPGPVVFHHGYLPQAAREKNFLALAGADGPRAVVGTRSSLFLPTPDPGMVVMDEEHDESYKQDEGLVYQAKELAHYRVKASAGVLVLASATPDVKTFRAGREGALPVLTMTKRVGGGSLPEVVVEDLRPAGDEPFTPGVYERMEAVLGRGEQVVVMLNRRGYAPLMFCRDCRRAVHCPDCNVSLTFHKGRERLVCHYCGHSLAWPLVCPDCGGTEFQPMGEGTQRLEEALAERFGRDFPVARLDRDSTRRPQAMEAILDDFARGRTRLLVGTQMLSKGHHFPKVTLMVAADADMGRSLPDYRAQERSFQLLLQAAGRSGRGADPGQVAIQTRNPDDPFFSHVASGDYLSFYEREIALRERYRYPPFVKLALVRLSFPADMPSGPDLVAEAGRAMKAGAAGSGVLVLGPAPAPMSMMAGRRRFNCLLKGDNWPDLRMAYASALRAVGNRPHLRLSFDPDPLNMM